MKKKLKKMLERTTLDDRLVAGARRIADKTTVDDRLFSAAKKVKHEIRKNIAKAVLAAFGFMIALVWRDVIKEGVNKMVEFMGVIGDGYTFTLITALVTTIICVFGIIYVSRWSEK